MPRSSQVHGRITCRSSTSMLSVTLLIVSRALTSRYSFYVSYLLNLKATICATSAGFDLGPLRVVSGVKENYTDEMRGNSNIVTVGLPWLGSRHNWSSMSDFSNVLYQRYEWTADSVLCLWIETPRFIKMRHDAVYR